MVFICVGVFSVRPAPSPNTYLCCQERRTRKARKIKTKLGTPMVKVAGFEWNGLEWSRYVWKLTEMVWMSLEQFGFVSPLLSLFILFVMAIK